MKNRRIAIQLDNMAMGDNNGDCSHNNCTIDENTSLQKQTERPKTDTTRTSGRGKIIKRVSKANPMVGDKDILFGRGKSIRQRAANTRLLNFIDIFQDHYSVSGPFQRNQIVRWIIEMLQNDGYSFRKWKRQYPPSASTIISESGCEEEEEETDESESENSDDNEPGSNSSWVEASPAEVQKNVAQFFQKPIGRFINAPSVTVTQSRWQQQHNHHQQQMAAFHQAISSAIDTSSLAATLRNEELQQHQSQVSALNLAVSSAIDTSCLAKDLRDCPSPESYLVLSTSTSSSSFDPVLSLPSNPGSQEEEELELESFLLNELTATPLPIELQSSETPNAERQSSKQSVSASATVMHAQKLLQKHSSHLSGVDKAGSKDALPKDGVLWSRGSQQIRLLEGMEDSIVPVTSFSLLPNTQHEAFGEKEKSKAIAAGKHASDKSTGQKSRTIGYTEQQVGGITILRPIVLLPE